ncbi:Ig-like domain-containing protein [Pectobacterium brasiliense]|uniref:Ig-like domain-containing protein n=1 Tax=Pectobacterium brasiliense TaxID=180957 RepID=UPI001CE1CE20|nr:Ig-like domain-containing protein [Pectobacterium brasiliense]MCA5919237.1 Ig-like domain-containing protein [Pectobacterium brasiliense]MCA5926376.1 Ig-like domain-containing protein [Pectobacterium brasiliense]MCA5935608.1 Ig-like domain-containing protein [Pectobacterium brasiliense]MCA5941539.1 Ig-like domain-containing protein [Pectobacterium brasiliense]MCA5943221.1 Ig-like domain-containing protein [Pectobacterium brasiliense]
MDQKFFRVPFAQSGDRQTIPDALQSSGVVSFPSGWGGDYAKDPAVDANAKPVEREAMNAILYAITNAVRQYQTFGFPEYITPADNNGGAFSYSSGAVVRYRAAADQPFKSYVSIADNNTSVPGSDETKWQEFIYREATTQEITEGTSGTTVVSPRRLKERTDIIDGEIDEINDSLTRVGNLQVAQVSIDAQGSVVLNAPTDCVQILIIGHYTADAVESRDYWESKLSVNGAVVDTTPFYGYVTGSRGHGHHRRELLPFSQLVDMQLTAGDAINFEYSSNRGSSTTFTVFYIQGVSTDKPDHPTAIIISPGSSTINAGGQQQLTATVLPAGVAADYPVTWSVSDPALGSVDSNGLYTANSGVSGTQSVIASVSTGLASTATITQHIYLTNIDIGNAPPNLIADRTYTVPITYSPSNYTEPVQTSSSDSTIATLSIDGTLTISSGGTATLTLTGASSGVTDSITITATEEVLPEVYLQIDENLAEIATAGAIAQAAARSNLGLGGLATKDGLTAADVGAVPQASASLGTENLNTVISPGRKFQSLTSNATLARNYPVALAGMLDVIRTTDAGIRQTFYPYNTTDVYHRYCVDVGANPIVFSAWAASGGDFLAKSQNLADVPDKPLARDNMGVGYTISTSEPPASAAGYAAGHIWYQV